MSTESDQKKNQSQKFAIYFHFTSNMCTYVVFWNFAANTLFFDVMASCLK